MYLELSCMRKPLKGYNFVLEIQKFHRTEKYLLRDREPKSHVCIGRK